MNLSNYSDSPARYCWNETWKAIYQRCMKTYLLAKSGRSPNQFFKTYYHLLILMSYNFLVHQQQVVTASLLSDGLLLEQLYADLMMLVKSKKAWQVGANMNMHYLDIKRFLEHLESDQEMLLNPNTRVFPRKITDWRSTIQSSTAITWGNIWPKRSPSTCESSSWYHVPEIQEGKWKMLS